jgi:AraC-like DNA-binding protein
MRVTHIDNGHDTEASGTTLLYKGIYDRVLEYFNNEKPYLNSSLTINDVVEVVFSNKLYISRAISQFGGKNFCQFVNYYRIVHSLELFRQNPTMKISDLAIQSGFNSAVSFGMAFNLFMGQKPGDWCRRERYRLEKLKK